MQTKPGYEELPKCSIPDCNNPAVALTLRSSIDDGDVPRCTKVIWCAHGHVITIDGATETLVHDFTMTRAEFERRELCLCVPLPFTVRDYKITDNAVTSVRILPAEEPHYVAVLAGTYEEFMQYKVSGGLYFDEVIVIGSFWRRRDAHELHKAAMARKR